MFDTDIQTSLQYLNKFILGILLFDAFTFRFLQTLFIFILAHILVIFLLWIFALMYIIDLCFVSGYDHRKTGTFGYKEFPINIPDFEYTFEDILAYFYLFSLLIVTFLIVRKSLTN